MLNGYLDHPGTTEATCHNAVLQRLQQSQIKGVLHRSTARPI